MNRQHCYLCVDIGTQSIRTALVDQNLQIIAVHSDPQQIMTDPVNNQIEVNIEHVWESVAAGSRDVLQKSNLSPSTIAGVCVGAIMHVPVPIDENGTLLLRQVQIYSDKRCKDYVRAFQSTPEALRAYKMTGSIATASWLGFKLRWIKQHQPDIYKKSWKFLTASAYINFRLTGNICIDYSEASGSYLMDQTCQWNSWLATQVGVDIEKLPEIRNSWEVLGGITEAAASATGLTPGTPVVVGGGDMGCAALAVGSLSPGDCVVTTGTSSGADLFCQHPVWNPSVINLRHVVDGWLAFGSVECCGGSMTWLRKHFFPDEPSDCAYQKINQMASSVPAGSDGVLFLPQLLGERENLGSPDAKGAFIGLSFDTDLAHLCRSLMEGVCYAERRILDAFTQSGMHFNALYSRGGGVNSRIWNQIRCDIYQHPIHVLEDADNSGLIGAALLAGKGVGLIQNMEQVAKENIHVRETYYPNTSSQATYAEMQKAYMAAHNALLPTFEFLKHANIVTRNEDASFSTSSTFENN